MTQLVERSQYYLWFSLIGVDHWYHEDIDANSHDCDQSCEAEDACMIFSGRLFGLP